MFPTLPSLISRQVGGQLLRTTRAASLSASAMRKTPFFTANASCGCIHRPLSVEARCPALISEAPEPVMRDKRKQHGTIFLKAMVRIGGAGVGLAVIFLAGPVLYCDPVSPKKASSTPVPAQSQSQPPSKSSAPLPLPPPPQSSVNLYELSFGTVCGICAGVFVKKGARMVAFTLGGVFVLLQYLGSISLVRVDWGRVAGRFENLFYTTDAAGVRRPPNVGSLFRWIVDFLTADFQPRATFIAGFALGLRIG